MNNFKPWQKYPLIAHDLEQVNHCLNTTIKTAHPSLQKALVEMANNGGKYLRPTLLLLAARASNNQTKTISPNLIKLASSIEILHMATLIHDDIIDDSDQRRGTISIQAHFGKDTAVYAGDLLFTHFFSLMLETISDHQYLVKNAQTMRLILNGELGQMAQRFNIKENVADYLKDIQGKTAALFKLATEEGAFFAGADPQTILNLSEFGQNLGIAFQIVDDILDYTGGNTLNKPVLEDLTTGVYSLPVLLALKDPVSYQELQPLLIKKRSLTKSDIKKVQTIILASSAIKQSQAMAKKYSEQALNNLKFVPNNTATKILVKMTKELLKRTI